YRFLSRLFGVDLAIDTATGKKYFAELAKNLLPEKNPGLHNQAIMEFGALQCVPSSPVCTSCPFIEMCSAFRNNTIPKLPVKKQKTTVKNRFFNYLYIENGKNTFLQKRTAKDVWQNLYEFPLVETDKLLTIGELVAHPAYNEIFGNQPNSNLIKTSNPLKHVLSHRVIHAQFFTINIQSPGIETPTGAIEVPLDEIDRYAVSRLMELFLESRTTI
ncbi:MAG TPA: NUDIX domain-containing protein, partial [Paludibacter sp.]|nr:NUDIX domain-containing protein [Paludibacter sp.]